MEARGVLTAFLSLTRREALAGFAAGAASGAEDSASTGAASPASLRPRLPEEPVWIEADGDRLKVLKEGQDGNMIIGIKFPCVVTFTKPSFDPRYPTIKRKMAANRAEIPTLTAAEFPDIDTTRIGLKGSPTHVKRSFVPERKKSGIKIQEETAAESAAKLAGLLSDAHVI